jgi:hypothetical protein
LVCHVPVTPAVSLGNGLLAFHTRSCCVAIQVAR